VNKRILLATLAVMFLALSAFGQTYQPLSGASQTGVRWGLVSGAFVLGIAAAAGAIGQARAIAASVEGIARNPTAATAIRGSMIIGLALIESLVIYALVIAFIVVFK